MKKKIAKSLVVIGQNMATLSLAGLLFTNDQISAINATLALSLSLFVLLAGDVLDKDSGS